MSAAAQFEVPAIVPADPDANISDLLIERVKANRCDIVVLDTRAFEEEVALVQLPMHMKAQVCLAHVYLYGPSS